VPTLGWTAIGDGCYGVSIIAEAKHGGSVGGSSIGSSISKTPVFLDPIKDAENAEAAVPVYSHLC